MNKLTEHHEISIEITDEQKYKKEVAYVSPSLNIIDGKITGTIVVHKPLKAGKNEQELWFHGPFDPLEFIGSFGFSIEVKDVNPVSAADVLNFIKNEPFKIKFSGPDYVWHKKLAENLVKKLNTMSVDEIRSLMGDYVTAFPFMALMHVCNNIARNEHFFTSVVIDC